MMDAIASPPSSARDNLWRQAKAVAEEEPAEAARISRELSAVSESKSVHEEIIRSLTHVLLDRLTYKKVSVVRFLQELSTKKPYVKDFLLREGGIVALAAVISGPDDATRNYSTQLLMSLGREDSMHKECVTACLEQLRDADNGIKAKIAICRVLNVIMLHDNGATIMECNGVVDIARVMTEDPSWDSFAVRTLSALAAASAAGDAQSKRDDHITHALISVACGEQGGGNLRGNLARMLSMLSGQNKTGSLQQKSSSNGLSTVASLLKEAEGAARAYATECLLNVCKRGARMKQGGEGTGSSDSNSEFVSSYVIAELVQVLKDGENDERVTPKTMEKACRVVADVIVDRDGVWRESALWNEKELVTELGKVVGESEGAGSVPATVWASKVLLAGCRAPPGSSSGDDAMLKVQNRKRMMDSTVGDQFRWALNQQHAKREAFPHMKAFMSEAGISEVGVPGLEHHLKIVMKNVEPYEYSYVENGGGSGSGQVSYDGERGHRIHVAVTNIRKKLSSGNQDDVSDNIDTIIDSGALPYLIALLGSDADKHPNLEEEVLWVLTNLVSGTSEQTCAVVEAGVLPSMIRLVNSSNPAVQDQAVWGLGNISGDSAMCRDEIFDCGVVAAVQEAHTNGVLGNAKNMDDFAFLIMNLMRVKPLPHIDETKGLLPIITDFVKHLQIKDVVYKQGQDISILVQMLTALSAFTAQDEHGEVSMDIVIGEKIMPTLSRIMNQFIHRKPGGSVTGDTEILTPLCRIFGNFCGGSEQHTQAILDIEGVDLLFLLANHEDEGLRKEAWFTLSNMAAGSDSQVATLIEKGVFSRAFDIMSHTDWSIDRRGDSFYRGAPQNTKNEICWCICNPLPDPEDPGSHQTKRAITDAVLGSRHSQAGDKHDEEDRFHGVTAIFESIAVLERQVRERDGDVAKNIEMATKLMGLIKCLTSDESLALHDGIKAKIKEKGRRYVAIIKSILKQPGDIARIAEDVTEQIIMHI
jgi:hypothetical protein